MNFQEYLEIIKNFVLKIFTEQNFKNFSYHNLEHTLSVVNNAAIIGKNSNFNEIQMFILLSAAWFHDVGYIDSPNEHEERSKIIAKDLLESLNLDNEIVTNILCCIEATKMPQHPSEILSNALCDADLAHISQENFFEKSLLIRDEMINIFHRCVDIKTYWEETLRIFENHQYHTEYGKNVLNIGKEKNLIILRQKIEEIKLHCCSECEKKNEEKVCLPSLGLSDTIFHF